MNARKIALLVTVGCLTLLPTAAWAQQATGTIAGVVRDTTGAVMPGVTVEAASPALIEKIRTAVTDEQGQYKIVNLVPGAYTVTFTLTGFSTVKREGLDLTASFTATVNAEMKVGSLEETITVSGQAPVVDTQNVMQQTTIGRTTLDAIPTTKRLGQYATIIPGATYSSATFQDVGGAGGEGGTFGVHGQRAGDLVINLEGMNQDLQNGGIYSFNAQTFQEVVLETSGISSQSVTGGVQVNIVPKDGGNILSGSFSSSYSGPKLQHDNLTDELRARGLLSSDSLKKAYDVGAGLGGPIKKDKLWFFTAIRTWGAQQYAQGVYYNKLQGTPVGTDKDWRVVFYEPDLSRPAYVNTYFRDASVRLTWQPATKHKIVGSYSVQPNCSCTFGLIGVGAVTASTPAPEALDDHVYDPNYLPLVGWSYPATNRFLLEAGASANIMNVWDRWLPETGPNTIAITDLATNRVYGSIARNLGVAGSHSIAFYKQYHQRFAVSYVTGSHAFKTGLDLEEIDHTGGANRWADPNQILGARDYTFRNQLPVSVRIWATPFGIVDNTMTVGAFAQDQWTIRKFTLNLGLRYSSFNASVPEQHLPAGMFVPARDFPAVSHVPYFKSLNPRLGGAYDLFGTGKTALKASLGRYMPIARTATFNPASAQAASATRTWTDTNANYVPDCDLRNPAINGECGRLSDQSFGQVKASNTRYADDALSGFNKQSYNWQGSVSVQQQLRPGMALNVGYFRTWYGGFLSTDNQFVSPASYDPYCITAPVDSRLPGGGGDQLCGLYDLTPTLFGQVDNLVTQASHYGKQSEVYNGVDVTLNTRFGQGGQFSGGLSVGRTVTDNCFVVDSPQQARPQFCHVSPPWSAGTQVKFLVVYPLPWDLQTSATYQNIPGIPITASYPASSAQIAPSLGRSLSAGPTATATIDLIPPGTLYEDRLQQVDLRFTRRFQVGKARVRGNFDIYNLLNASSILSENLGYGPQWMRPVQILGGRVFKFGGQLDF
jgi:hypothetical protein